MRLHIEARYCNGAVECKEVRINIDGEEAEIIKRVHEVCGVDPTLELLKEVVKTRYTDCNYVVMLSFYYRSVDWTWQSKLYK